MGPKIVINDKEIKNPVTKVLLSLSAFVFAVLIALVVVFFVLPFVGIAITATFAIVITILIALLLGIPILLFIGAIFSVILRPFKGKKEEIV